MNQWEHALQTNEPIRAPNRKNSVKTNEPIRERIQRTLYIQIG